jgi:hypothetical protein
MPTMDRADRRLLTMAAISIAVFSVTLTLNGLIDLGALLHDLICTTHR